MGEGPRLVVTGVGMFGKTSGGGGVCARARARARVLVCAGRSFSFAL